MESTSKKRADRKPWSVDEVNIFRQLVNDIGVGKCAHPIPYFTYSTSPLTKAWTISTHIYDFYFSIWFLGRCMTLRKMYMQVEKDTCSRPSEGLLCQKDRRQLKGQVEELEVLRQVLCPSGATSDSRPGSIHGGQRHSLSQQAHRLQQRLAKGEHAAAS